MPDMTPDAAGPDYRPLGFVANPFPPIDEESTDPLWLRGVAHAASNRLFAAVERSSAPDGGRPVLARFVEEVPEYYHRVAENDFLRRSSAEPRLDMMALNIPLDMMRLGRIRGTLTELAELVAAADLPATVGAYFAATLGDQGAADIAGADVTADEVATAAALFASDPHAAVARYLGARPGLATVRTLRDEDEALHDAYLRSVGQDPDPAADVEGEEETPAEEAALADAQAEAPEEPEAAPKRDADFAMRAYLIHRLRTGLSPVIARAIAAYESWGDGIVAQELKVTKAPRKTLAALLEFMSHRWSRTVVIYDGFDAWPLIETKTRAEILAALTELRWIIGEHGVMVVAVVAGKTPEIEEQFAAAEQVDWTMPEVARLYGDTTFDATIVQHWLDAASLAGASTLAADGPELAPLVAAAEGDLLRFVLAAEVAFGDAAARGASSMDAAAVAAGIASITAEDGA